MNFFSRSYVLSRCGMLVLTACLALLPAFAQSETPTDAPSLPHPDHEQNDDADTRQWPPDIANSQEILAQRPAPADSHLARTLITRLADDMQGLPEYRAMPGWKWRWERDHVEKKADPKTPAWLKEFLEVLTSISKALGFLGHLVLWSLLLLLLLALWRYRRALVALLPHRRTDDAFIAGINVSALLQPEALPDDVIHGAQTLWDTGHARDALSLLYRAALLRLGWHLQFALPDSGTESECLALVNRHADRDTSRAFRVLVDGWSRMAWQHRAPDQFAPLIDAYRRTAAGADAALQNAPQPATTKGAAR